MTTSAPRVIVVGGGLAGLSAGIACARGGASVTLLEARPRLGGATWSFERNGLRYDNGQHVHLACCTAYRGLLDDLGTSHLAPITGPLAIPVLRPTEGGGRNVAWIRRNSLPAPLHLGASLLSYGHLTIRERISLLPAALGLRLARLDDPRLDTETFSSWLRRHGQNDAAIERLWDLITLPTTNLRAAEVSAGLAAKVFQTGLLTATDGADIAWSRVPLADLHVEPARALLTSLGARVQAKARVTEIMTSSIGTNPLRARGVVVDGEILEGEAVIVAVPHDAVGELLPPGAVDDPARFQSLGHSPIVNVHVLYDRKVMAYQLAAGIESPVQFVFDRTAAAGVAPGSGHQVVAVSLSGADDEIGERPEALIDRHVAALRRLFPLARNAEVLDAVVTRERAATFRGVPGTRTCRAMTATGIDNVAIAGAWTDTGWPATMEGAVRSGQAAAKVALRAVGRARSGSPRREEVVA